MVVVKQVDFGSEEYRWACRLREAVLRVPLGLILSRDDLEGEEDQIHFVAFLGDVPCGTCVIKPWSVWDFQLRQMVVAQKFHGRGVGKTIIESYEWYLSSVGAERVWMNARVSARGFYERIGYVASGDVFEKVGIPHVYMDKDITPLIT